MKLPINFRRKQLKEIADWLIRMQDSHLFFHDSSRNYINFKFWFLNKQPDDVGGDFRCDYNFASTIESMAMLKISKGIYDLEFLKNEAEGIFLMRKGFYLSYFSHLVLSESTLVSLPKTRNPLWINEIALVIANGVSLGFIKETDLLMKRLLSAIDIPLYCSDHHQELATFIFYIWTSFHDLEMPKMYKMRPRKVMNEWLWDPVYLEVSKLWQTSDESEFIRMMELLSERHYKYGLGHNQYLSTYYLKIYPLEILMVLQYRSLLGLTNFKFNNLIIPKEFESPLPIVENFEDEEIQELFKVLIEKYPNALNPKIQRLI